MGKGNVAPQIIGLTEVEAEDLVELNELFKESASCRARFASIRGRKRSGGEVSFFCDAHSHPHARKLRLIKSTSRVGGILGHAFCTVRLESRDLSTGALQTARLHYCDIAHPSVGSFEESMERSHGGTFVMLKHLLAAVRGGQPIPRRLLQSAFVALVASRLKESRGRGILQLLVPARVSARNTQEANRLGMVLELGDAVVRA